MKTKETAKQAQRKLKKGKKKKVNSFQNSQEEQSKELQQGEQKSREKVFYQNVKGLKSKICALDETIDDYDPSLILLVETHLAKEEPVEI